MQPGVKRPRVHALDGDLSVGCRWGTLSASFRQGESMSLCSLGRLARQRDFGEPMTALGRPLTQKATTELTPQTAMETLAALIP